MSDTQPPSIPYNPPIPELKLKDLLNLLKTDIFKNLNCHAVATVQSFAVSGGPPRIVATINYQKTNFVAGANGVFSPQLQPYPTLVDCPAIVLGGGATYLNMPIQQGDECLILFNDRDMSTWYQGNTNSGVPTARMHSFADGVALVGLYNSNRAISDYDLVRALITNGTVSVGINPGTGKVTLTNGTSLGTLLNNLITAIKAITTLNSDSTTGAVSVASQTALANIATQLEGLLE